MIVVHCHSNLDLDSREVWPKIMSCVPRVGDLIESKYVWPGGVVLILEVVGVVWAWDRGEMEYTPRVELHLAHEQSIADFHAWYKSAREPIAK